MSTLTLASLLPHPDNANRMSEELMDKLASHIRETGEYPPLIVRPHPTDAERFQLLDGHHRAEVLKRLGFEHAQCEIWYVDDDRASLLLLTLNRLHGEDDPQRRGALLARLAQTMGIDELAKRLPDEAKRIAKLIDLTVAPPPLASPPMLANMPHSVTFFMTAAQRNQLLQRLDQISSDRSRALMQLLNLN